MSLDSGIQTTKQVYSLVRSLPRLNHETPKDQLPENGLYFFFEQGEAVQWNKVSVDRIVRIGTHRKDGRFRKRIQQHYGNVHSFGGNKNGSVFRKHVGGALLRRSNSTDLRLGEWLTQGGSSFIDVEIMVSRLLRQNFTFSCIRIDRERERLSLEKELIALVARHPLGEPSSEWLGKHAVSEKINHSGLWNTQHIDAESLTPENLRRFETLVRITQQITT